MYRARGMTRTVHNSQLLRYVISPMESNSLRSILCVCARARAWFLVGSRSFGSFCCCSVGSALEFKLRLCTFSLMFNRIIEKSAFLAAKRAPEWCIFAWIHRSFFFCTLWRNGLFSYAFWALLPIPCRSSLPPSPAFVRSLAARSFTKLCIPVTCAAVHIAIVCFVSLSSFRYWFVAYVIF